MKQLLRKWSSFLLLFSMVGTAAASAAPVLGPPSPQGAYAQPARQEYALERSIAYPRLVRGNPSRREIALTFDDGPYAELTPRILAILRQEHVPATFFVIGKNVEAHPEIVQQEVLQGSEVANHTYDHKRLTTLSADEIRGELHKGGLAIERATGSSVRLFRPPGGEYDANTLSVARRLGYVMVLWTDDPGDFKTPQAKLIESRVMRDLSNGSIILLHEKIPETADMLADLIHRLKAQGYRFVTCSEMARESGAIDFGGPVVLPARSVAIRR